MPKILCLHGARSSSDVTKLQLFSLGLDVLGCELVSVTSPLESETSFDGSISNTRSWQTVEFPPEYSLEDERLGMMASQLRQSLVFIAAHVREHGPYDGAYGFSQGASIVTLLSDEAVRRSLGIDEPLWDFAIIACGVDYLAAQRLAPGSPKLTLPSIHLIGDTDPWRAQSEALLGRFERPRVLRHPYGHELPLTLKEQCPDLIGALAEYVLSPSLGKPPPGKPRGTPKGGAASEPSTRLLLAGWVAAVGLPLLLYEVYLGIVSMF